MILRWSVEAPQRATRQTRVSLLIIRRRDRSRACQASRRETARPAPFVTVLFLLSPLPRDGLNSAE
jgi:hypothetical protein